MFTVEINNLPKGFDKTKGYIVATICDGHLWFWGYWEDEEEAYEVCKDREMVVVRV